MRPDEYRSLLRSIDTRHGRFAYLDVGDGPATLFVHGLFVSAYMWHQVIDDLKRERRCLAYNLPHHSGSQVADDQSLDLEANVEMLAGFCDELGLEEFDLVANDTGGALGQGLAVRQPGRVRTLALTNCEARDWMPSQNDLGQAVAQLAQRGELAPLLKAGHDDRAAARQGALATTFQWPDRVSDAEIDGLQRPHQATLEGARRLERFVRSLQPEQLAALEPDLRRLEVPTIAVWGTGDDVFPLHLAEWLRETIPGCREVVEIEGGRLFWPFERGEELVAALRRHWQQSRPREAAEVS